MYAFISDVSDVSDVMLCFVVFCSVMLYVFLQYNV